MSDDTGTCVAPGCGAETRTPYHHVCDACRKRVEDAMVRARPSLMEAMVDERAEAEAWLASEWAPRRRWVLCTNEYVPLDPAAEAEHLAEEMAGGWAADRGLGFVDDELYRRRESREDRPQLAWIVPSDSETASAWRAHMAPIIQAALEEGLRTFPLAHAGREIKAALTQDGGYDVEGVGGGFEELWEGSGPTGLSDAAEDYLELRYYPDETWMCDIDFKPEMWRRHPVLSDDIMAIVDAANADEQQD